MVFIPSPTNVLRLHLKLGIVRATCYSPSLVQGLDSLLTGSLLAIASDPFYFTIMECKLKVFCNHTTRIFHHEYEDLK